MRSGQRFSYLALDPEETRQINAAYHQRIHKDQSNLILWIRRPSSKQLWTSWPAIGKSPVELERFQQDGEAETSYPRLVTEEFEFVWTERPTLGEFVGVPRPLHGPRRCTRLKL
jgi:hypothetical protein